MIINYATTWNAISLLVISCTRKMVTDNINAKYLDVIKIN